MHSRQPGNSSMNEFQATNCIGRSDSDTFWSGKRAASEHSSNRYLHTAVKRWSIFLCFVLLGCTDPLRSKFDDIEDAVSYTSHAIKPALPPSDSLVVLTWNLRFGSARIPLSCEGWGERYDMTKSEIESNLLRICGKINEVDPDVVLFQEIDVESKRTAYVDELQFVLDHTGLNYAVYAAVKKSDYEPGNGTGRINVGNAILSRWPLNGGARIALPVRSDISAVKTYFRSHRNILKASLSIPGHPTLHILNIHADPAGAKGMKKAHIDIFKQELDKVAASQEVFVAGGDFNALPPGSPQWKGFPDKPPMPGFAPPDYSGEETWMVALYDSYKPALALSRYQSNPASYYTITEDANGFWCRTLDHLFANTGFRSTMVLQDSLLPNGRYGAPTMPMSDHAPLYAILEVKP